MDGTSETGTPELVCTRLVGCGDGLLLSLIDSATHM